MIRPCSCRHDVEWTTSGSSGYHFMTSGTASWGLAEGERPTSSESAWIGFIQTSRPSRSATGRTSRVWATNRGDQSTVEMGGPIASTNGSTFDLALRGIGGWVVDHSPQRADLGGRDLQLVRRAAVLDHLHDQLRLRSAHHVAAAARDLHEHGSKPSSPPRDGARMLPWRSLKTWRSRRS